MKSSHWLQGMSACMHTFVIHTMYMFRAICKFTQFRNCPAQIRNCEIGNQFRNWKPISKLETNFEIGIQFRNCARTYSRNFEIALRKLEIAKWETNFEIGVRFRNCAPLCAISKFTQFRNCAAQIRNYEKGIRFRNCAPLF